MTTTFQSFPQRNWKKFVALFTRSFSPKIRLDRSRRLLSLRNRFTSFHRSVTNSAQSNSTRRRTSTSIRHSLVNRANHPVEHRRIQSSFSAIASVDTGTKSRHQRHSSSRKEQSKITTFEIDIRHRALSFRSPRRIVENAKRSASKRCSKRSTN